MATPYKMKGHSLPGPNQKSSPAKILGITAAMIIAAKTAAIAAAKAAAVSAVVGQGVKAARIPGQKKKVKVAKAKEEAAAARDKSVDAISGEIGSKSKIA